MANRCLVAADAVTFRCKDYRVDGPERFKTMTLATGEFIRRFLIDVHAQPAGRIVLQHAAQARLLPL